MEEITQLISNVGFPIVACIFMYKQQTELTKSINELQITMKEIQTQIRTKNREE